MAAGRRLDRSHRRSPRVLSVDRPGRRQMNIHKLLNPNTLLYSADPHRVVCFLPEGGRLTPTDGETHPRRIDVPLE